MFLSHQTAHRRLPVVLLTGFLGSGKTTLINHLLRLPQLANSAVAINEFGEIPLDQHLIEHGPDKTIVLANGCLCCNLAGDMAEAVMRIFSRRESGVLPRFERLIIEPSGLADPAPIAQSILRNPLMSKVFRLEALVATADALFVLSQLERHPESVKQIGLADQIILTKTDLVDAAAAVLVKERLRSINPVAPIHIAHHGAADAGAIFPQGFLDPASASASDAQRLASFLAEAVAVPEVQAHGSQTCAVSLTADARIHWQRLDTWLRGIRIEHAEKLLRLKGLVNIAADRGPVVIQGVHHVMHTPIELPAWPDHDHRTRIVMITQGVQRGTIEASWHHALPALNGESATNRQETAVARH